MHVAGSLQNLMLVTDTVARMGETSSSPSCTVAEAETLSEQLLLTLHATLTLGG